MRDVPVRSARSTDCVAIIAIAKRGWNEAYGGFLEQASIDAAIDEWYTVEAVREWVQDDDVCYLVADRDGQVLGYASGVELEDVNATAALSRFTSIRTPGVRESVLLSSNGSKRGVETPTAKRSIFGPSPRTSVRSRSIAPVATR